MTTLTDAEHEVIARLEQAGIINDIRRNLGLNINDDTPDEEWIKVDKRIANMSSRGAF